MKRNALALIVFIAAGATAAMLGPRFAAMAEARYAAQIDAILSAAGFSWARASVDGLRVELSGRAPSATSEREALAVIEAISPTLALNNQIVKAPTIAQTIIPPQLEILKGEDHLILTGVIKEQSMIAGFAGDTSMLTFGASAFTANWAVAEPALLTIADKMRHVRISVSGTEIAVTGLAETETLRREIGPLIDNLAASGWTLKVMIDTPQAELPDFGLRVRKSADTAIMSCSASTTDDAASIETAAQTHLNIIQDCAVGAGAPDGNWAAAVQITLTSLAPAAAFELVMKGHNVSLAALPPTSSVTLAVISGALRAKLPKNYRLTTLHKSETDNEKEEPAPFKLTIDWPGGVDVSVTSTQAGDGLDRASQSLGAQVAALFPLAKATFTSANGAAAPKGWRNATRVGLEALSMLTRGTLLLEDGLIRLDGAADETHTIRAAHRTLSSAGANWRISTHIAYDPTIIAAAQPVPPSRCAGQMADVIADTPLSFQPASSTLTTSGMATIDKIATILRRCPDARFEIGGHTDAQGSEAGNLALSRNRAEAVLTALIAAKAPPGRLVATGYGESRPVASNETAVGRALNRRIEIRLIEAPE